MVFSVYGGSGNVERMRILGINGNVGIGSTSPGSKLDVLSAGEIARFISNTTTLYTTFKANGSDVGYIGNGIGVISGGSATDFGFQSINNTVFSTGGSGAERMRIASGGNVYIGHTDDYGARFSVKQPASGNAANFSNGSDADLTIEITATGAATKYAKLTPSVAIPLVLSTTAGSNVGINTTSPGAKLHVVAGSSSDTSLILDHGSSAYRTYFGFDGTGNYIETNGGTTATQRLRLQVYNGSAYTQLFVDGGNQRIYTSANANVGIGITNPSAKLDLVTDGNGTTVGYSGIHLRQNSVSVSEDVAARLTFNGDGGTTVYGFIEQRRNSYDSFALGTKNSTGTGAGYVSLYTQGNERIRIAGDGNVGIGTTAPAGKLDVRAGSGGKIILGSYNANYNLTVEGGDQFNAYNGGSTTAMFIQYAGGNTVLNGAGTGNVGINTTSPGYKLEIIGGSGNWATKATSGTAAVYLAYDNGFGAHINAGTSAGSSTYILECYANNTSWFYVRGDGNIGIGTTSPSSKLYVEGGSANWSLPTPGTSVGTIHLDPGVDTDNYGNAITFGASDSSAGSTAMAGIYVRTDGAYGSKMYFGTTDSYVAGSKIAITIDESQRVGIGSTAPTQGKLVVNGGVYATSFTGSFSGSMAGYLPLAGGTMTGAIQMSNQALQFDQSGTRSWNIAASGGELNFTSGDSGGIFDFDYIVMAGTAVTTPTYNTTTASSRTKLRLWGNDTNYAIGMESSVTFGGLNDYAMTFLFNNETDRGFWWGHSDQSTAQGAMALTTDGNLTVAARIRVGYGTSDTTTPSTYAIQASGDVDITGTLTAAVKSFVIDHPTKADKKLQYGVLEGPEHSVYVRGRLKNTKYITLPDYWHALVHEDSITVNLTAVGRNQEIWVEQVNEHEIIVGYEGDTVEYFYTVFAERKDIDKLVTEFDKEI